MDFGITVKLDQIQQLFAGQTASVVFVIVLALLIFTFLPAIFTAFLNRRHFKNIFIACIPASLSFIAWLALLGWAVTGKVTEKKSVDNSEEKS